MTSDYFKLTMQKVTVCLIIGVLLGCSFATVSVRAAEAAIRTEQEALTYARQLPFVPDDALLHQAVQSTVFSVKVWDLMLARPDKDSSGNGTAFYSMRVRASDGVLMSVNIQDTKPPTEHVNSPDVELLNAVQAEQIASSFIGRLNWSLDADWRIDPYPEPDYDTRNEDKSIFKIRYVRFVQGIRFEDNKFIVYVNPDGSVHSYYASWSAPDFADPNSVISPTKAKEIFTTKSQPVLYFMGSSSQKPQLLVYNLWQFLMKANDGAIPAENNSNPHANSGHMKPIVSKSLAPLVTKSKLTSQQMLSKAKLLLGLTGSYKVSQPIRGHFKFVLPEKVRNQPRTRGVRFNLNTGQVELLYVDDLSDYRVLHKPIISEKKARETAVDFLKKAMPAYANKLSETEMTLELSVGQSPTRPAYKFTYNRVAGAIAVAQETVNVEISAYDGKIRSLQSYLSEVNYPNVKPKINAENAKQRLLSLYNMELRYRWTLENRAELYYELVLKPSIPRFYMGSAPVLDAVRGGWWNIAGEPVHAEVK